MTMRPRSALTLLLLAACATPGIELVPTDRDFAFLEIDLRG
ncbi:MAG: hypothetical protein ABL997_18250 [Planctomycetota bacterium]